MNDLQNQVATLQQENGALTARLTNLEGIIGALVFSDRYIIGKTMQFQDGRNIQLAKGTGTKIGLSATEKLGFYGKTPIVQVGAITSPTSQGATYDQSTANTLKTAIDAIRTALINLGLTA